MSGPAMLDQITYTTNSRVRNLLAALGPDYAVFDIHSEEFLRKRASGSFATSSTRMVSRLTHLPVIGPLLLREMLACGSISAGGCEMVVVLRTTAAGK